jgi:DNA-binding SARP family transcriptional activator
VEVYFGHRPVQLGGVKPRTLLAALVLENGRVVTTSRLVDVVWGEDPPDTARSLIQTYVSTLRKSFASHGATRVIATRPPGYVLQPGDAFVDVDVFTRLVADAKDQAGSGDLSAAAQSLREAIALWRGKALSGLEGSLLAGEARRLDELRLSAIEERFSAELRLGRLDHLSELSGQLSQHPTNERLRGHLMVTLHREGAKKVSQLLRVLCVSAVKITLADGSERHIGSISQLTGID